MLRILYDHQTFSLQRFGGISRYFANMYSAINRRNDMQASISLLYSNNYYIRGASNKLFRRLLTSSRPNDIYKWNKRYSRYIINRGDFDIFHPTYYNPYFLSRLKKPYVITVHDMIHEKYPEFFDSGDPLSNYKRICVKNASHIIAISECTKDDICTLLNVPEEKISVVYHGYEPPDHTNESIEIENIKGDYILFVGDRRAYKNFYRFIKAVKPIIIKNSSLRVICAGGGGFQSAESEFLFRQGISHKISQVNASDVLLHQLYKNALLFVYPSLYEGFGLPLLEAFSSGCPVAASSNPCFKEICADAAAYFDPLDEHSIARTVEQVIYDQSLAKRITEKGKIRTLMFPMDDCVNKTLELYSKIAYNGR